MEKITIIQMSNVWSKVTSGAGRVLLEPCLTYTKMYSKKVQWGRKEVPKKLTVMLKSGRFFTGYLPRIEKFCKRKGYDYEIKRTPPQTFQKDSKSFNAFLAKVKKSLGENYRKDQLEKQVSMIDNAVEKKRGVLLAPTGTGKTTLALGIAAYFPKKKILYTVHTKTLVTQTAKEFKKFGWKVSSVMEGNKIQAENIVVATRQSLVHMELAPYDFIMIDEGHHIGEEDGSYGEILERSNAPYRFVFTATFREAKERARLAIEGHAGEIIAEFTMEEAQEMEVLAVPKIRIIKVPKQHLESRVTDDIYKEAVVNSRVRNRLLCKIIKGYADNNKITFIFVTALDHGRNIQDIASNIYGMKIPMVEGSTTTTEREKIKKKLLERKLQYVIATVVWKEGLNIPTLDAIINASGGKDDLPIIQLIGRGLRLTIGKTTMDFVDFFDQSHISLIRNFGNRISLYCDRGWL